MYYMSMGFSQKEKCMCELFSGQDPRRYTSVRRSLRLRGFVTSLSLEQYFGSAGCLVG